MKKLIPLWILCILLIAPVAHAGDIPETLLRDSGSRVYTGKVKAMEENSVRIQVQKVIKGAITPGTEQKYDKYVLWGRVKKGDSCLVGLTDDCAYLMEISGSTAKDIRLKAQFPMARRMEDYLHQGRFDSAAKPITIEYNGRELELDQPAILKNNRTFVPIRFIADEMGYETEYNAKDRSIRVYDTFDSIRMTLDQTTYSVNGQKATMATAPFIMNNRTYVPLRLIAETMCKNVQWDPTNQRILITDF